MSDTREYRDSDGNPCDLGKLVRLEPEWAANQIRHRDALERELSAARAELATARAEMRRHLPILEYAESLPPIWSNATSGTGIATLNAYRKAAGMDATAGEVKA